MLARNKVLILSLILVLVLALTAGCGGTTETKNGSNNVIKVGSQTYNDPIIVAEMIKALIEENTDYKVEHTSQLAASMVVHEAMVSGQIDFAPRYTGTEITGPLGVEEPMRDPQEVYDICKQEFAERWNQHWFEPLGFNNTYCLAVRAEVAEELGLEKISDLREYAEDMSIGTDTSWSERPTDGLPAFEETYDIKFGKVYPMEVGLVYRAANEEEVDIICAYSIDSRIKSFDLKILEDDLNFFPPYECAIVASNEILEQHPEVKELVAQLSGKIDNETIIGLSYQVDEEGKSEAEVARAFLTEEGLI